MNEKKRFSDFPETLHINSTPRDNFEIFLVKLENFLMGLYSILSFDISDKFTKDFQLNFFIKGFLI